METLAEAYRTQLLELGFLEATESPWYFFIVDTALTAFFVNLKVLDDHICVFYGFASTAFTRMAGCENSLNERGIWEEDNCLRFYGEIRTESEALSVLEDAGQRFRQYRGTEKEALLKLIQEKRKAFLHQIDLVMKPLGFRKKGNQWHKPLGEHIVLKFWADKSTYVDKYYFEVNIFSTASNRGLWCFTERLDKVSVDKFRVQGKVFDSEYFDWQLQSGEELASILDRAVTQYLLPLQSLPLPELGAQPEMWKRCICPRDRCESCWIQKNLWEARESE